MRFSSVLVANRGEIAVRVMRTAAALGYRTVAVYSDPDATAPHVRAADLAVYIGPGPSSESYLRIERVLHAARVSGAGAIHPGYGFLSESPAFARRVANAGLVFVGPSADTMEQIGNKARARILAAELGVPTIPGYQGPDSSESTLQREAERIGFPLMIKAAAGGGGRGMRRVERSAEVADAIARARSEAERAFGDGTLLLERAIDDARHVEVQILGDEHGTVVHLGERDCSVQRRFQKIIEESPSPAVDGALRARLGDAAVLLAKHVGYRGAGTVEFLLDANGGFYFLEVNARLQVEHPVTELVTGRDLVACQFAVAQGEPLGFGQGDIAWSGHAIEARLLAEDPRQGFLPQTGRVVQWTLPSGVRVDHGLEAGFEVTPFYDSMLAKVVAHGPTRDAARQKLHSALMRLRLFGVTTNQRLLAEILAHEDFAAGRTHTRWVEQSFASSESPPEAPEMATLAAVLALYRDGAVHALAGWSNTTGLSWPFVVEENGKRQRATVRVVRAPDVLMLRLGDKVFEIEQSASAPGEIAFTSSGLRYRFDVHFDPSEPARTALFVADGAAVFRFRDATYAPPEARDEVLGSGKVLAPMDGTVVDVVVKEGDRVEKGQAIVVLEAMKMQLRLGSGVAGTVTRVLAETGKSVRQRQVLAEVSPLTETSS